MHQFLFKGTPYQLLTWNVCYFFGILITAILIIFVLNPKDFKMSRKTRFIFYLGIMTIGILGGKITSILLHLHSFINDKSLVSALMSGSQASMGSYFFALIAIFILSKKLAKNISFLKLLDFGIPMIYLIMIFARIGCFFNGCCYGAYTNVPWANVFEGRHPTQLYSIIVLGFVVIMTIAVYRKKVPPGTAFFSSLSMYSFLRFFIELIRVDSFEVFKGIMFAPVFMLGIFLFSTVALILNFKLGVSRKF